jgi:hypothetical protein
VWRALTLAVLLAGCLTTAPAPGRAAADLELQQLSLEFPEPLSAVLTFVVPGARDDAARLSWELLVDGRTLATGVEARPEATGEGVLVRAPFSWRHPGWQEGARFLDVRVRGEVQYGGGAERRTFAGRRELLTSGGPAPPAALEP